MNREILFKGKRIGNYGWVAGDLIQGCDSGNKWILPVSESDLTNTVEVIPETVSQYIGMKDKAGKKIFDGDIGEIKTQTGRIDRFVVKWGVHRRKMESGWTVDIPGFCFWIDNFPSFPIAENYQNGHDLDIISIIGNIHDNPELL